MMDALTRRSMLALGAVVAFPLKLAAQEKFPQRPIKLVVPFAPGGVVDVVARLWAEEMRAFGTIVIENQAGAGGSTGTGGVARAAADGYTLLMANTSTQVVNPLMSASVPYDPVADFAPISVVAIASVSFAVNPALPVTDLASLIAYIKANPGKVTYGSPGTGTISHLAGEIFKDLAGLKDLAHVPYRGAGPALQDLVAGHIPVLANNVTDQGLELHRAGKIRIVSICATQRLAALPDVAPASETLPGLVARTFTAVLVPVATPQAIIDQVAGANRAIMSTKKFQDRLAQASFEPVLDTPSEAKRFIEAEIAALAPRIKALGK
jgi:tripartite-type tricarboxylate transporter receptor subunit TctC